MAHAPPVVSTRSVPRDGRSGSFCSRMIWPGPTSISGWVKGVPTGTPAPADGQFLDRPHALDALDRGFQRGARQRLAEGEVGGVEESRGRQRIRHPFGHVAGIGVRLDANAHHQIDVDIVGRQDARVAGGLTNAVDLAGQFPVLFVRCGETVERIGGNEVGRPGARVTGHRIGPLNPVHALDDLTVVFRPNRAARACPIGLGRAHADRRGAFLVAAVLDRQRVLDRRREIKARYAASRRIGNGLKRRPRAGWAWLPGPVS